MVTDNNQTFGAETPESTETPEVVEAEVEDSGAEEESTEEPDYKALYEEQSGKLKAVENNLHSERGARAKTTDLNERLFNIETGIQAGAKEREALMGALSPDLKETFDQIGSEVASTKATNNLTNQINSVMESLEEAVMGEDGKPILDLQNAPELADIRVRWDAQVNNTNGASMASLTGLVGETHKIVRTIERKTSQKELADARKATTEARKKALDEVEANDMSLGGGGAGGGINLNDGKSGAQRIKDALPKGGITEWNANNQQ